MELEIKLKEIDNNWAHVLYTWGLIEANLRGTFPNFIEESLGFSTTSKPTLEEIESYDKRFGENSDYYTIRTRTSSKTEYLIDFYLDKLKRNGFESIRKSWISGEAFEIWYKLNHPQRENGK